MKESILPVSPCPTCDKPINAATGDASPQPNDLSICFYCGTYLKFNDDLRIVALPTDEFDALPLSNRFRLQQLRNGLKHCRKFDA